MSWVHRLDPGRIAAIAARVADAGWLAPGAALVHDLPALHGNQRALAHAFPAGTLHATAIKANPVVGVLRALVAHGAGLEAASLEEVHLALAAGCAPDRIVYDSPAKTVADLAEAMALGIRINADNADELARIAALDRPHGPIGIRVNPAVGEGSIAMTAVAGRSSRFGVPTGDVAALLDAFPFVTGLHVHVGSQGCPLDLLVAGVATVAALARDPRVTWLDVGGGLPAWYDSAAPPPPTPADHAAALRAAVPDLERWQLVTEFGRALLSGSGFAVTRVEYVKHVPGHRVAVGHLGADLLLRAAYLPAQWRYEVLVLDPTGVPKDADPEPTVVAGPLCFAGDVVARADLPRVDPGDLLVFRDTGAYTVGMWSRHCSRGIPVVLGHDAGALRVLRARETPADVVRFWEGPDTT